MNISSLIIRNLRICPESAYILAAVGECDNDGNISHDNYIIRKLQDMIIYGPKHNKLYCDMTYKIEGLKEEPSEEEWTSLKDLALTCGLNSYENLQRVMRWTKFKNTHGVSK